MHPKLKKLLEQIEPWHVLGALVIGIVTGFCSTIGWIHSSAQNAVLDEKFLATLAAHVRPACIFDSNGTIEADLGAEEYIEDIQVTPVPQKYGFEITIKAKRHLAYAPLVSAVNVDLFPESVTRGKMNDWKILMTQQTTMHVAYIVGDNISMDTNTVYRFKLEILH